MHVLALASYKMGHVLYDTILRNPNVLEGLRIRLEHIKHQRFSTSLFYIVPV